MSEHLLTIPSVPIDIGSSIPNPLGYVAAITKGTLVIWSPTCKPKTQRISFSDISGLLPSSGSGRDKREMMDHLLRRYGMIQPKVTRDGFLSGSWSGRQPYSSSAVLLTLSLLGLVHLHYPIQKGLLNSWSSVPVFFHRSDQSPVNPQDANCVAWSHSENESSSIIALGTKMGMVHFYSPETVSLLQFEKSLSPRYMVHAYRVSFSNMNRLGIA